MSEHRPPPRPIKPAEPTYREDPPTMRLPRPIENLLIAAVVVGVLCAFYAVAVAIGRVL